MSFLWSAAGMIFRVDIGFGFRKPAANDSALFATRLPH
jgi:hypothetical protein